MLFKLRFWDFRRIFYSKPLWIFFTVRPGFFSTTRRVPTPRIVTANFMNLTGFSRQLMEPTCYLRDAVPRITSTARFSGTNNFTTYCFLPIRSFKHTIYANKSGCPFASLNWVTTHCVSIHFYQPDGSTFLQTMLYPKRLSKEK